MRSIGPELISAASDNDPTNVGTAAAVGAQTGYQLSWLALLVAPLLAVVLTIAGQVGTAARDDLQSLTLKRYGRGVAAVLLVSVVAVNVVTIAADLQAGAAGVGLLAGIDSRWLAAPLGAAVAGLLLAGRYGQVVAVLRYLMLGFAAFGAAAVLAHPDWPRLLAASLVPVWGSITLSCLYLRRRGWPVAAHTARWYSLISPPRTLRHRILGRSDRDEMDGMGWDHA